MKNLTEEEQKFVLNKLLEIEDTGGLMPVTELGDFIIKTGQAKYDDELKLFGKAITGYADKAQFSEILRIIKFINEAIAK